MIAGTLQLIEGHVDCRIQVQVEIDICQGHGQVSLGFGLRTLLLLPL